MTFVIDPAARTSASIDDIGIYRTPDRPATLPTAPAKNDGQDPTGGSGMKRIRIERPKLRRDRPWLEVLPPDPRDPDVLGAKALCRSGSPREEVTRR